MTEAAGRDRRFPAQAAASAVVPIRAMDPRRVLEASAFVAVAVVTGWAAQACRGARRLGMPGADARAWMTVAVLFLALACSRLLQAGTWLGVELRHLARTSGLYESRRPYQIAATVALAGFAAVAFTVGLRSIWEALKRYRLAASCIAVIVTSALIRFVSLHEIDAWNRQWPWIRVAVDLGTSGLTIAAALTRVRQVARARLPRE